MKRESRFQWIVPVLAAAGLAWLLPVACWAQAQGSQGDLYQDPYADEGGYQSNRLALGFGAGIVLPNENGGENGEVYYSANFRWRVWGRGGRPRDHQDEDYNQRHNQRHYRGRYPGQTSGGIQGYLEPEVGYWKRSDSGNDVKDLLIGLNLLGVVPTRNADFYLGVGFGIHSFDGTTTIRDAAGDILSRTDLSKDRLGGNLQVGVEVYVTPRMGIFGTGRLDILEDQPFDRQTKIWGGLRFHF